MRPRDVRFWHKADIRQCTANVRYWGKADIGRRLKPQNHHIITAPVTSEGNCAIVLWFASQRQLEASYF